MPSISVALDKLWLNSTANPSDCLGLDILGGTYHYSMAPNATVAEWAGGTFRSTGTKGITVTASGTPAFISDADAAWLQTHAGLPVWVRDWYAHRFVATVPAVDATPYLVPDLWSVPLAFTGLTFSDAV